MPCISLIWQDTYSGTWTDIRLRIDTSSNTFDVWLDGKQIGSNMDIPSGMDISSGISIFELDSGRGDSGHDSYVKEISLRGTPK